MFFSHVLDNIGFPMKRKLIRSNSVLVYMCFRIHRYVAAPWKGLVICEDIDLHEYNFWVLQVSLFLHFWIEYVKNL
jgi:hypothetical protein